MTPRFDLYETGPAAVKAMLGLEAYLSQCGLDKRLIELIKLRCSQINGCGFCVDMHVTEARKIGESERRLHAVAVWRMTPFFDARERAVLAWAEAMTLIAQSHATDALYEELRQHFSDKEVVDLTMAVNAINGWNRLVAASRKLPE
ncbi:carboxymuconolactone decarboxylase family protein [Chitinivorax sp. PXF-14]|uniref:carboxymuconolactone decarboxylase family protein n=1 Tax=Chitinivorax sp. PXF-14 TaxID=3230488 RepID=UPI0034669EA1